MPGPRWRTPSRRSGVGSASIGRAGTVAQMDTVTHKPIAAGAVQDKQTTPDHAVCRSGAVLMWWAILGLNQ
jgi:hypothetical protein